MSTTDRKTVGAAGGFIRNPGRGVWLGLAAFLVFQGALFAQEAEEEPRYAEIRPEAANREEFTVMFYGDGPQLDPRKMYVSSEAQLATAIHEGLFSYSPTTFNEPVPALASEWQMSPDKKTWTFTIRENARYSNGDPIRAQDFRATWISLLDPRRESPYSSLFDIISGAKEYRLGTGSASRVGIKARDDRTLELRLTSPASFLRNMLCHHSFSVVHPSLLNTEDWAAASIVGSGPFAVESLETAGEEVILTLAKNTRYWDAEHVALSRIIVRCTENDEVSTRAWNSGQARWVAGNFDPELLADRSGFQANEIFATSYWFIRSAREPWNDWRVRRALSLAIPWDQVRQNYPFPAKTLVFPLPGYPALKGLESPDEEEARRLLAEAGYPGGAGLPEIVIRLTPSNESARIAAVYAAAWLSVLGVRSRMDVVPYGTYFDSLHLPDYDVGYTTWIGDFLDPWSFLQMFQRDSNLNDARHNDPDYEKLLARSLAEEGVTRLRTLSEAENLLLERGTVLPVSYGVTYNLISTNEVGGWRPNILDIHPFKYLEFVAFRPLPGVTLFRDILSPDDIISRNGAAWRETGERRGTAEWTR